MANFNLNDYVPVSERITKFYADFPNGRINTDLVSYDAELGEVLFKAFIYREKDDAEPSATGYASESKGGGNYVNKTSLIENCETSAVGRALAMLGYELKRGVASREEMEKVQRQTSQAPSKPQAQPNNQPVKPITPKPEIVDNADSGTPISDLQIEKLSGLCDNPPNRKTPVDKNKLAKFVSNGKTEMLEDLTAVEAVAAIDKVIASKDK
jgi:hypothetical protein